MKRETQSQTRAFALLAGLFLVCGAHAQERFLPPVEADPGIVSSSVRFYIIGSNRAENVEVAIWVEEVSDKVAAVLGADLPQHPNDAMIRIYLDTDPGRPRLIEQRQTVTDWGFHQELRLQGVGREDQFAALKALCALILNRHMVASRRYQDAVSGGESPPDWLVFGLAASLSPPVRAQQRSIFIDAWKSGEDLTPGRILGGELPQPWRDAAQAEFFQWLAGWPESDRLFQQLLAAIGQGEDISMGWLLEHHPARPDARALAQEWDLRVANMQHTIVQPGACSLDDLYQLKERLLATPELLSIACGEETLETLWLGELISLRDEEWMPTLAEALSARAQEAALGRAPELQQVAGLYLDFLRELQERSSGTFWTRSAYEEQTARLEELLRQAEQALEALEQRLRQEGN